MIQSRNIDNVIVNIRKVTGIGTKENIAAKISLTEAEKYNTFGCPESGLRKVDK